MITRAKQRLINATGNKLCDICNIKARLVQHHINGRTIHDPHNLNNLCNICDNCHRKIHEHQIKVEGWLMTTNGLLLMWNQT